MHWWGGNPHSVEGPGHFPEDEAPMDDSELMPYCAKCRECKWSALASCKATADIAALIHEDVYGHAVDVRKIEASNG